MAYHYEKPGTMPIVIGGIYTRWLSYHYTYKLKLHNSDTGLCKLTPSDSSAKHTLFISASELSNWHLIRREKV